MQACSNARCDIELSLLASYYVQKIDRLDGDLKGNETNIFGACGWGCSYPRGLLERSKHWRTS